MAAPALVRHLRILGDVLANWADPFPERTMAVVCPVVTQRLPPDIVSHIASFLRLPDNVKGGIVVMAVTVASRDPSRAVSILSPFTNRFLVNARSPSAPPDVAVDLARSLLAELNFGSIGDFQADVRQQRRRCRRLRCLDPVYSLGDASPCCFHTGLSVCDHDQHAASLERPAWIGGHRRRLSVAPFACCSRGDSAPGCRVGYHLSALEDAILFGSVVLREPDGREHWRQPLGRPAVQLALEFLLDAPHRVDMDDFEWGRPRAV
ncbi:Uncharacterized protein PBTT_06773 [Plasmodiophora brassicae]